jgi:assimilatory nitrate reductase catalytic subunit
MSRTGTLGRLLGHVPEPVLDMHPSDMAAHGLHDGDLVEVRSRRGMLRAPVQASEGVGPGQAHMAMHWGEEALSGRDADGMRLAGVNALTQPAFCPSSKQPELKHAAVAIAACPLPWRFVAVAWLPAEQALATREALKPWMGTFDFSSCTPFGREPDSRVGLVFRAAHRQAPELAMLQALAKLFGLGGDQLLRYDDPAQHQHRWLQLETQGQGLRIRALLLAGGVASERWLRPLLQEGSPVETHLRRLLDPSAIAPLASAPRSKQVCTCFNVNEAAIVAQLSRCDGSPEVRLASLQSELKCGTNCGSCLPTLRKLVQATPLAMAGA